MPSFKIAASACSIIFGVLFLVYGFAPSALIAAWGVTIDPEIGFMATRVAAAMLGFAVLLWLLRDLPQGAARRGVVRAVGACLLAVAAFGLTGYVQGIVNEQIFGAAAFEVAMAALLFMADKRG